MQRRPLGNTGLTLPAISFGASSIGQEFRSVDLAESLQAVRTALDLGMNFIDTSPFYGRGMSEILLGRVLCDVPRKDYLLGTKLGRYTGSHFDFSARRVVESIDTSLERMKVDHVDFVLCHDFEFVDMSQIVDETIPAIRKEIEKGKVRFVGISGYPMKLFKYVMSRTDIDVLLTYNHYTLQNTMALDLLPIAQPRGIGVMNAAPFAARLLTNAPLPAWHKATPEVRQCAAAAAKHCSDRGVDIAQLALQFSLEHPGFATCVIGSANPERVAQWVRWAESPIDRQLLAEVLQILQPIHDWHHIEGRPENND